ncbi:MAG TPA: hypothetical protein DCY89_07950 [Gammaproteobacteria bacterium]|nr:hypothetical protein [Gammaproteobacteria bacterium]
MTRHCPVSNGSSVVSISGQDGRSLRPRHCRFSGLHVQLVTWVLMVASLVSHADEGVPDRPFARTFDLIADPGRAHLPRGIHLRAVFDLARSGPAGDFPASELSGLAWDADEGKLYTVSDRGYLLTLLPRFEDGRLVDVIRGEGRWLTTADGTRLQQPVDAEGLVIAGGANGRPGDAELVVSFEAPARVARHALDGRELERLPLPAVLADPRRFASSNDGLEAIADSPQGLVVSPQRPLSGTEEDRLHLYTLADGTHWWLRPIDARHSSLADMARAGSGVLALERVFGGPFRPFIAALHYLTLTAGGGEIEARELLRFDSTAGFRMDNFEGLALHHDGRHVFLVTDDNQSVLQRTLLLWVELPADALLPVARPQP